jgi:hypothetical protein
MGYNLFSNWCRFQKTFRPGNVFGLTLAAEDRSGRRRDVHRRFWAQCLKVARIADHVWIWRNYWHDTIAP